MIRSQDLKQLMIPVQGLSALHLAAYRGHREICQELLRDPKGNNAIKLNAFASDNKDPRHILSFSFLSSFRPSLLILNLLYFLSDVPRFSMPSMVTTN